MCKYTTDKYNLLFIIHSGFVVARTTLAEPTAFAACAHQLMVRMAALSSATSVSGALVPFGRLKCKKLRLRHIAFLFIWPMPSTISRCFAQRKRINHYVQSCAENRRQSHLRPKRTRRRRRDDENQRRKTVWWNVCGFGLRRTLFERNICTAFFVSVSLKEAVLSESATRNKPKRTRSACSECILKSHYSCGRGNSAIFPCDNVINISRNSVSITFDECNFDIGQIDE